MPSYSKAPSTFATCSSVAGGSKPNAMHQLPRQTFALLFISTSSSLVHEQAAVDVDMCAVDEGGSVRREHHDDGRDLLGLSDPSERCLGDRTLEHLLRPPRDHRRVDDPWVHAV